MAHFQVHLQTLNGDNKSPITPSYLKLQIPITKCPHKQVSWSSDEAKV
jgi:hypothetical protein